MARKYTVAEIDALRRCHTNRILYGWYAGPIRGVASSSNIRQEVVVEREETIRTSMLAGHTSQDLIESEQEMRDAEIKRQDELLVIIRGNAATRPEKSRAIREFEATWAKG